MRDPIDKILLNATYSFFRNANWDGIKSKLSTLLNCMQSTTEQTSVNTQWTVLKITLLKAMQEFIQQKQIKPKHCLPWVTQRSRKLIRAKYRLHSKLKHNPRTDTKDKYKQASHTLQKETRKAYWAYLENIIDYTSEPNTQDRHTKQKRFWSFIKSTGKTVQASPHSDTKVLYTAMPQAKLTFLLNISHPHILMNNLDLFPTKDPCPASTSQPPVSNISCPT